MKYEPFALGVGAVEAHTVATTRTGESHIVRKTAFGGCEESVKRKEVRLSVFVVTLSASRTF